MTKISGVGEVAQRYGLEEAIFLDALIYWYRTNRGNGKNFRSGRWWSHNSVRAYEEVFPWWSAKQLRRIIDSCKAKGAVLSANYNRDRRDRTFWYSPSDEVLELYGEPVPGQSSEQKAAQHVSQGDKCNFSNGQMQLSEGADSCAQAGEALPCTTHENTPYSPPEGDSAAVLTRQGREFSPEYGPYAGTVPCAEPAPCAGPETQAPQSGQKSTSHGPRSRKPRTLPAYHPDWFERFWGLYPRRTNRVAAVRAWDRLRPDFALCRVMSGAIRAQKQSAQWQDPEHIPHPATWLNGARWLDEMAGSPSDGEPELEVRNGLR